MDSIKNLELTEIKLKSKASGLLMVGGAFKNFVQDTVVVCAELLGKVIHKYAIQITLADTKMVLVAVPL